jgi:hypothetical protein
MKHLYRGEMHQILKILRQIFLENLNAKLIKLLISGAGAQHNCYLSINLSRFKIARFSFDFRCSIGKV